MSSWWAAIHGYRHPVLDAALTDQVGRMSHVMFGGLTHEPAVRLASTLVDLTPDPLRHVFLSDSGSVSVEVAIKMCLQYWRSLGRPGKRRLAHLARRLPRRHRPPDERVRPRRRDAQPVAGRAARTALRAPAARRVRRGRGPRLRRRAGRPDREQRRRARRRDRRAGGAGRGRHALPRPALPARAARADPGQRRAADLRRDRHRVRPHRRAVRRRPRRESARTCCASARRSPAAT